jgi:hypothetical protein
MAAKPGRPSDDVSSAPESGTVRDDTSGNRGADQPGRPAPGRRHDGSKNHPDRHPENPAADDPRVAGEER